MKKKVIDLRKRLQQPFGIIFLLCLLTACGAAQVTLTAPPRTTSSVPTAVPARNDGAFDNSNFGGLSEEEIATLNSLEQVDAFPLYTMHYQGTYRRAAGAIRANSAPEAAHAPGGFQKPGASLHPSSWGCALFAALGDSQQALYGRNFDWEYSPALLLFTDPPDGYASVSMVDIAYLGFGGSKAAGVIDLPLVERRALLGAPFLPFDGMNEHGLAVGMAAVPGSQMPYDPDKETIESLMVIRALLDYARDVNEALALMQEYNITWSGGPPLHYLIADASGHAILVEFYQGEMVVIANDAPWHLATNFLRSTASETGQGECSRYDKIYERLVATKGWIAPLDAMHLLAQVSQRATQWSIVYEMNTGAVNVVVGQEYKNVRTFQLTLEGR